MLFSRSNEIRGVDLSQPYYHTIPTISVPQVLTPSHIDFVAKTSTLYWTDPNINEVKRSGLTSGPTQTIIDTGIENPTGLAIDWISELMYISSASTTFNSILASNLNGEYSTVILQGHELPSIKSLALDPTRGQLYFTYTFSSNISADFIEKIFFLEAANMDGTNRHIIHQGVVRYAGLQSKFKLICRVNEALMFFLNFITGLCMDLESWRLYWVNFEFQSIEYYDFKLKKVMEAVTKSQQQQKFGIIIEPSALIVYHDKLYYANQEDSAIHVCDKTTGLNDTILRNNTGHVLSLKIYDPAIQDGNNSCGQPTNKSINIF